MTEALSATAAAVALAACLLALLGAFTLAPFCLALTLAERRGYSATRWGGFAAAGILLGLACAAAVLRAGLALPWAGLGAATTWSAPLGLLLLGDAGGRIAGYRGRHE